MFAFNYFIQLNSFCSLPSDYTDSLVCMNSPLCFCPQIPDEILLKRQWPNICVLALSSDKSAAHGLCAWKTWRHTHTGKTDAGKLGHFYGAQIYRNTENTCKHVSVFHVISKSTCEMGNSYWGSDNACITHMTHTGTTRWRKQSYMTDCNKASVFLKVEPQTSKVKSSSKDFKSKKIVYHPISRTQMELFKLCSIWQRSPWLKMILSISSSYLPFKPHFSFMIVVYLWLKPFSVEDDREHLLFMHCGELRSNMKTLFFRIKDTQNYLWIVVMCYPTLVIIVLSETYVSFLCCPGASKNFLG